LRCSALRARPATASFDAPLNGVSDGIMRAMYASSRVLFPVPDAPEIRVAPGWKSNRTRPSNPPQFTSWNDSAFHCNVPSVAPAT
jgi:hypothetical protein